MRRLAIQLPRQAIRQFQTTLAAPAALKRSASRFSRTRRPPLPPHPRHPDSKQPQTATEQPENALESTNDPSVTAAVTEAPLVSRIPVTVPADPEGVLDRASGQWSESTRALLSQPAIVVARQLEPLNLFLGWEQANKYQLLSPEGHLLGYLLEEESSLVGTMSRQLLRTHRPFRATVISPDGEVLLRIQRPFSWINSRIYISTPSGSASTAQDAKNEMQRIEQSGSRTNSTALTTREPSAPEPLDAGEIIGETQQEWHLYRRRYNHFVRRGDEMVQFARTDGGFLAWDFHVRDENEQVIGSINRNFAGFGRELFTDTGQYVLRFEGVIDELNPQLEAPKTAGSLPEPGAAAGSPLARGLLREAEPSSRTAVATREDAPPATPPSLPLDHRAVLLATAITTDIDYFSRSRGGLLGGGGGMFMPMPIPMGGVGGAGGGAAEEAGTVGGAASEGPMPSTEYEEDEFAARARREQESSDSAPDPTGHRGDYGSSSSSNAGGGGGRDDGSLGEGGWNGGDATGGEDLMQDPWASEAPEEGGTWSWGDLFDQEGGGDGGGGDGDGW
ncbi:hypothetical protein JCM10908_005317 [Rhodotorula pacifica]|uniref:Aim25p n=1 Tax=Rhodotorula pacifica TaxID=1495444 RepID=UPI0031729430